VLAPMAYPAARFGPPPAAMAPLAASSLFASYAWSRPDQEPAPAFYAQLLCVLVVGLLLNHRRIVVTVTRAPDGEGGSFLWRLTERLREITGADGLAIYQASRYGKAFVHRQAEGEYPEAL